MHPAKRYLQVFSLLLTIIVMFTAGCTVTPPAANGTAPPLSPAVTPTTGMPGLVGVWKTTGAATGHQKESGFYIANTTQFTIKEQQGQAFFGTKDYQESGMPKYENISGVISDDGKKIYIAEHKEGYFFGEIVGPDEIALVYLQDGNDAAARAFHIIRQKN
ncbi:MAG: hypothetical protein WC586_05635 [Methanoregula sp.]